ncbi:hypothetical protein BOTBODRAFT_266121 [Botryobasidium botryosum FD-172 SS1]|uniref:Uncharacterized protein n=1 Tax=Botryobasidium botryosum (strain FD-172 SS1) TaxID=930990 RepID=A0A067MKE8_BOTB1|nr:hypothetical protein BOTBODRAFT_266121 [Botryobasidium botryosum FD-172 SS1]
MANRVTIPYAEPLILLLDQASGCRKSLRLIGPKTLQKRRQPSLANRQLGHVSHILTLAARASAFKLQVPGLVTSVCLCPILSILSQTERHCATLDETEPFSQIWQEG